jgi:predicted dehydrogenase
MNLQQVWPLPTLPRPIVIIGCGGIVTDAHLPAYLKAGLTVAGLFDIDPVRSRQVAEEFGVGSVFKTLEQAVAQNEVVFDLALPPEHIVSTLNALPNGATVLIQKPLGRNFKEAVEIAALCQKKNLIAATNFQLRFSAIMLALRDAIEKGKIGDVTDLSIHLTLRQPWKLWPFMEDLEAVEVIMHSIHYLDWIRSVLGEPQGVYCKSVAHRDFPNLADTRTSTILDYGDSVKCTLSLNHTWNHGGPYQEAGVRIDGTKGAAYIKLGLLLNYPEGEPEELHLCDQNQTWQQMPINHRWFPDAFIGVMSNLQRFAADEDNVLHTAVADSVGTMALVEACWRSSQSGATPIPAFSA